MGTGLSMLGGQLTTVAVLFQIWRLSHSPVAVGAVGLAHAVPMVLVGLAGGSVADAVDRRALVLLTTAGQLVTAVLLAAQALAGARSLPLLFGLVALQSAGAAAGAPARRTFVARLLPPERVAAGVALNQLSFQVALLLGPAIGGLLIARAGVGSCFLIDALSFGAALHGVRGLPAMRPLGAARRPGLRTTLEGWRFIAASGALGGAFLADLLATVLSMPVALLPVINAERFGDNPRTLGLSLSAIGVGGIAAGAASGAVTRLARPGSAMLAGEPSGAWAWRPPVSPASSGCCWHAWRWRGRPTWCR